MPCLKNAAECFSEQATIAVLDSAVLTMAGYTLANICSMLLSLFLGVYMTTAKAAFVNDLTAAAPSDNASGKMTE